jgi:hypothetical protein
MKIKTEVYDKKEKRIISEDDNGISIGLDGKIYYYGDGMDSEKRYEIYSIEITFDDEEKIRYTCEI